MSSTRQTLLHKTTKLRAAWRSLTCAAALTFAATALLGAAALPTHAAVVTYSFQGKVDTDQAERGYQVFTGSFRFDSTTLDAIADNSTGAYKHSDFNLWWLDLSFDGAPATKFGGSLTVVTANDLGGMDQLGVVARQDDNDPNNNSVSLSLYDYWALVLSSDGLPTQPLTLDDFGNAPWSSSLQWSGESGLLSGYLTQLDCLAGCGSEGAGDPNPGGGGGGGGIGDNNVPEPASAALVLLALGAARLQLRRRNERSTQA